MTRQDEGERRPGNRLWVVALAVASMLLVGLVLFWSRAAPPPTPQAEVDVAPVVSAPPPAVLAPTPDAQVTAPDAEATALPTSIRLTERLAARRGLLHVRCFVGEEYSPLRGVEEGWYAFNTPELEGWRRLGDTRIDAVLVVRWSAPEGATSARCVPEPPRWAYLTVTVYEEDGAPAPGVGILGCGVLQETGDDGRVEFPVLAEGDPCVLDVYRWDGVATYSKAFLRLPTLAPDEERVLTARLVDHPVADGEETPRFDLQAGVDPAVDPAEVLTPLEPPTIDDRIADYEDRLASSETAIADYEWLLSRTPEDERWLVEERLESARSSREGFADYLEGLYADADARAASEP